MKINATNILNKITEYGDHLVGHSARRLRGDVGALSRHHDSGPKGIPVSTIKHVTGLSNAASASSLKARAYTAAGITGGAVGGFLGLHKYHQHKDNKIMERIDKMYQSDYT